MRINIYAIYDTKSEAFGKPLFFNTDGLAQRSFYEACEHEESEFKKYPHDFSLLKIGTYDDENGKLQAQKPEEIATALEVTQTKQE